MNTPIYYSVFHNLHAWVARCSASCVNEALCLGFGHTESCAGISFSVVKQKCPQLVFGSGYNCEWAEGNILRLQRLCCEQAIRCILCRKKACSHQTGNSGRINKGIVIQLSQLVYQFVSGVNLYLGNAVADNQVTCENVPVARNRHWTVPITGPKFLLFENCEAPFTQDA